MQTLNSMVRSTGTQVFAFVILVSALMGLPNPASAQTQTIFGTLNNFDVFNDTGQAAYGFEIELHGITSKDISFTFGSPYQARYGTPVQVDFVGGVFVRYESKYDSVRQAFTSGTPVPPSITPTAGHSCWTGGRRGI